LESVSLIVTVKNEARAIGRLLDSISAQTRRPDEVVIADGGSSDETVRVIGVWGARQSFPVRLISAPGANISQGRNAAIRAAQYELIASTDAGVRLDAKWLGKLLEPFEHMSVGEQETTNSQIANRRSQIAGGFFLPDPQTAFEMAMSATVLPVLTDVNPEKFLPSSRSLAFAKTAWQAVGGYPEWLDFCEDLVFDFALREKFAFMFAPEAIAYFRPRGSLRSFFRQYYLYARGDGKADLWRKRHAIRYATYLIATPALVALSIAHSPLWLTALAVGMLAYCRTPYRRLMPYLARLRWRERLCAIALVPIIRVVGDVAKMLGYPVGVAWRTRWLRSIN
jgi:glycosyltransferase involved in cell wall biosynthesis